MEQALMIINEAWVSMNGEEFAKLCLDSDPEDLGSQNWINENFRRFRVDLGGQINKTDNTYLPKLAAGLVKFHNDRAKPQTYYVLVVDYGNGWEYEYGAYDRADVIAEKLHVEDHLECSNEIKTKVIKTTDKTRVCDLINNPKGSPRPAASDQLAGPEKPATVEKPKSKNVKIEKKANFGDREAFRNAAIKAVEDAAKARKKSGALISEADLVSGAVTIMQLIDVKYFGANPDHIEIMPPAWLFNTMRGDSINGGSLPINTVLVETWTEYGGKLKQITAPQHLEIIEKDYDEIKKELTGDELADELDRISDIRHSIIG